ncbi:MAG TPA: HAD-IIIA family hydrolase [Gemmatimonadales bacterium]|nr:HAD-IIIA family hydrolase [Gemmatimonadales bacterium]
MIVYRNETRCTASHAALAELRESLGSARSLGAGPARYDRLIALLIDGGALESAVADALCPEIDRVLPPMAALHRVTRALAGAAWCAWRGIEHDVRGHLDHAADALSGLERAELPSEVALAVPEGFAHYAVYPECYFEAAARLEAEHGAERDAPGPMATCLGLRTIGATLVACVTAVLAERGWQLASFTVRPRGHPFDRRPRFASELAAALRERLAGWFLVVDEGPGLSGSSLDGTVDALVQLGVPEERIALFPSWCTDGSALRSARARDRWPRLRQTVIPFENVWLESGRLARACGAAALEDLSAGAWRRRLIPDARDWPAVQPQHERRKYLDIASAGGGKVGARHLLRFAGLGRFGARRLERAQALSAMGWSPEPLGVAHGFLCTRWVEGTPLAAADVTSHLIAAIARYAADVRALAPAEPGASREALAEMAAFNAARALGDEWGERAHRAMGAARWSDHACIIDGRMLPHEWLRTPHGYMKTDALDHGDDHFMPGPQDIAWDLAAAAVEFALDADGERALVDAYARHSGDRGTAERLPAYRLAYLAFRVGYCTLAAEALGSISSAAADAERFRAATARYAAALRDALCRAPASDRHRGGAPRYDLVIFDADGTLRRTTVAGQPCPFDDGDWELRPGVPDAIRRLATPVAPRFGIASNQDRIAYGQLTLARARRLLRALAREALGRALPDDAIQLCPHADEAGCSCRKPAPAMLERIMAFWGVPPERTLFVGDAETDREAARRAGIDFIWADDLFGTTMPDAPALAQQT